MPAYAHEILSHDTLGQVTRVVSPELFRASFNAWVAGFREHEPDIVAIDGKTPRHTHARTKRREPLYLVSA